MRYKTKMCRSGTSCKRSLCFFAHTQAELRAPCQPKVLLERQMKTCIPEAATQQYMQPVPALAEITAAAEGGKEHHVNGLDMGKVRQQIVLSF